MNKTNVDDLKISELSVVSENSTGKREDYLGEDSFSETWFERKWSWKISVFIIDWEEYFMGIAFLAAQRSKDPATQVGACIVDEEKHIVGIGYNGFPAHCGDDQFPWTKASTDPLQNKYLYVVHAETNGKLNSWAVEATKHVNISIP